MMMSMLYYAPRSLLILLFFFRREVVHVHTMAGSRHRGKSLVLLRGLR